LEFDAEGERKASSLEAFLVLGTDAYYMKNIKSKSYICRWITEIKITRKLN